MHSTPLTNNACADGDCIVWTEDSPVAHWTQSSCEKNTSELDEKMPMLGYYSSLLSPFEEDLPPKYDSRETGRQSFILCLLQKLGRYIFVDHLVLKVVAAYLFLVYFTGATYLSSSFDSLNWRSSEGLMRLHSRDFMGQLDVYEIYDDNAGWSTSKLGRVGHDSPLLTFSEFELLGEMEWEAEPDTELELENELILAAAGKPASLPLKVHNKLPLPFRMPSNVFEYSRNPFHKNAKHELAPKFTFAWSPSQLATRQDTQ